MGPTLPYGICLCIENTRFATLNFGWICFQSFITHTLLAFWVIALTVEDKMIPLLTESFWCMNLYLMGISALISQVSVEHNTILSL